MFKNNKKIAKLLCSFLVTTMVIPLPFSQNNVYATDDPSHIAPEHSMQLSPMVQEKINNTFQYSFFNVYKPKDATPETNMCVVYSVIIAENI